MLVDHFALSTLEAVGEECTSDNGKLWIIGCRWCKCVKEDWPRIKGRISCFVGREFVPFEDDFAWCSGWEGEGTLPSRIVRIQNFFSFRRWKFPHRNDFLSNVEVEREIPIFCHLTVMLVNGQDEIIQRVSRGLTAVDLVAKKNFSILWQAFEFLQFFREKRVLDLPRGVKSFSRRAKKKKEKRTSLSIVKVEASSFKTRHV